MKLQVLALGSRPWQAWRKYWGLSILIDDAVLFDTFASFDVLSRKLKTARVDVASIEKVVISHDHWDHAGGLDGLLAQRGKGAQVYLPSPASVSRKQQVVASGALVTEGVTEPVEIAPQLFLLPTMMGEHRGKTVPEQALIAQTEQGCVMIVGCAHPGIVAMVRHAKQVLGQPVSGVIGGLHLMSSSKDVIATCAQELRDEGITMISPTHCTGWRAERMLKRAFGRGYLPLQEKMTTTL